MNNHTSLPDIFSQNKVSSCPVINPIFQKKTSFKTLSPQDIHLEARLVCEYQSDNHWVLYLTNISGSRVAFLVGRAYAPNERLYLSDILFATMADDHQQKVDEILSDGMRSSYWNLLFSNMLGRRIKIRNPVNDEPRFIKILMNDLRDLKELVDTTTTNFEFSVKFIDETNKNLIYSEHITGAHDIRSLTRMGLTTLAFSPFQAMTRQEFTQKSAEELAEIYDQLKQRDEQLLQIFSQTLNVFSKPLEENVTLKESSSSSALCSIDSEIDQFLKDKHFPLNLKLSGNTSLLMLESKILETLKQTLKLTIELFVNHNVSELSVTHRCDETIYICDILLSDSISNVEEVVAPLRETEFQFEVVNPHNILISKPAIYKHGIFSQDGLALKLEDIQRQIEQNPNVPVILFVDDVLLNIKMLVNYCTREMGARGYIFKKSLITVDVTQWQERQVFLLDMGAAFFVLAANGDVASKVIEKINIDGMISDMEMPGFKNGESLILWTKVFEQRQNRNPMMMLVNTGLNERDYFERYPRLSNLEIPYVCKGTSNKPISQFIDATLAQFAVAQSAFSVR